MFVSDQSAVMCRGRRRRWFARGQLWFFALALATAYPGLAEAGPGSSPPEGGAPQSATPNKQPTSPDKANPDSDGAKQLAPRPRRPRGCPHRDRSLNLIV